MRSSPQPRSVAHSDQGHSRLDGRPSICGRHTSRASLPGQQVVGLISKARALHAGRGLPPRKRPSCALEGPLRAALALGYDPEAVAVEEAP